MRLHVGCHPRLRRTLRQVFSAHRKALAKLTVILSPRKKRKLARSAAGTLQGRVRVIQARQVAAFAAQQELELELAQATTDSATACASCTKAWMELFFLLSSSQFGVFLLLRA